MFKRQDREKIEKFSIRKFKVGVGSALIALSFVFVGGGNTPIIGSFLGTSIVHAESVSSNVSFVLANGGGTVGNKPVELELHSFGGRNTYSATITAPSGYAFVSNNTSTITVEQDNSNPFTLTVYPTNGGRDYTNNQDGNVYNTSNGRELGSNITITYQPNPNATAGETTVISEGTPARSRYHSDDGRNYTTIYEPGSPRIVSVGTQPKVTKEKITSTEKQYVKDPAREKDSGNVEEKGSDGEKEVTITYELNTTNGNVTPNAPVSRVISNPSPTIVHVPAKDKIVYSKKNDDIIKTITEYTVNPNNGEITSVDREEVYKQNGAKDKVVVTPIAKSKRYVKDTSRAVGTPDEEEQGQDGTSTVTTTYTVNPQDGSVVAKEGKPVVVQPRDTVVKVGAKDKVEVTPIKSAETVYEKDDTRDFGTPNVETPSQDGSSTVTTTYEVNPTNGEVTPTVGEPVVVNAQPKVIKVGAKTKVVYSKNGDDIIKTTTEYDVNRNTGVVTPTESTDVFKKDGAKDKVDVTTLPAPKQYEKDDSRDFGEDNIETPGKDGTKTIVTKYTVIPTNGEVTAIVGEPVVVEPTPTIVQVPAKDKVVYKKQGNDIIKSVTKYEVDRNTGTVTPTETEEVFKKDGAKDTVEVTTIPSPKQYQKDDSREVGTPNVEESGQDGTKTVTTTYEVNPKDGSLIPHVGEPVIVDPTVTVVKVGAKTQVKYLKQGDDIVKKTISYEINKDTGELIPTETVEIYKKDGAKDKVNVEVIPTFKTYVKDGNREVGTLDEITQGKDGSKTTTTTYEVNENTGEVIEHKGEPIIVNPVPTVVSVGAKDKVVLKNRTDGAKEKETTKYDVDKDTGKLTENVTTELLSSKGNEAPPVVQPEEFAGGVNGTDAPIAEELPVLKVGIVKDKENNVIDVIKVDEEPKEIEGYTNTGKVETDNDGNKVYTYEKNATSSNGTELPPVVEELPVLKVGIIKDTEGNVIDVIKVDEEPKEIEGYSNTGKVETDKDGNKVYTYEKVKQEKQKEEPKAIDTENPVVEKVKQEVKQEESKSEIKEEKVITKETSLPKTNPAQGTAELLGLLLGSASVIKSRKRK